MKKTLLVLLIFVFVLPAHAEEAVHDKDLLLMDYMALNAAWVGYVCNKPALDFEDPVQKRYAEQEVEHFANWLKATYGKNWRAYINFYIETYTVNSEGFMQQTIIDTKNDRSVSLEDTLFCKHFLELDAKASEMFKK